MADSKLMSVTEPMSNMKPNILIRLVLGCANSLSSVLLFDVAMSAKIKLCYYGAAIIHCARTRKKPMQSIGLRHFAG